MNVSPPPEPDQTPSLADESPRGLRVAVESLALKRLHSSSVGGSAQRATAARQGNLYPLKIRDVFTPVNSSQSPSSPTFFSNIRPSEFNNFGGHLDITA